MDQISRNELLKYALIPGAIIFVIEFLFEYWPVLSDTYFAQLPGGIMLGHGPIILVTLGIPFVFAYFNSKTSGLGKVVLTSAVLGLSYRLPSILIGAVPGEVTLEVPEVSWLTDLLLTVFGFALMGAFGFFASKFRGNSKPITRRKIKSL